MKVKNRLKSKLRFNKHGWSFIEILMYIIIVAILTVAGITGYNAYVKDAKASKVAEDLKAFEDVIRSTVITYPQLTKIPNKYQDTMVYEKLSELLDDEMRVDFTHSGSEEFVALGGSNVTGFSELESDDLDSCKQVAILREDAFGSRIKIFVNPRNLQATGDKLDAASSKDTELRIFVVSNGDNQSTSDKPYLIESKNDIVLMVEVVNGDLRVGYHNVKGSKSSNQIYWASEDAVEPGKITPGKSVMYNLAYAHLPEIQTVMNKDA